MLTSSPALLAKMVTTLIKPKVLARSATATSAPIKLHALHAEAPVISGSMLLMPINARNV